MRQAKINVKGQTSLQKDTLEDKVRKSLANPLFKIQTTPNEVLGKLLSMTGMQDKDFQRLSTKEYVEKQKLVANEIQK